MSTKPYYLNYRKITLHAVSLLTLAIAIFVWVMIFSDYDVFLTEFSSKASGIAWTIFMLLMGNCLLVCMFWLSGRYVLAIAINEQQGKLIVKTWSIIGIYRQKEYPVAILDSSTFQLGQSNFLGAPSVNAPWLKLKTPQGKILVVDLNGEFFNEESKGKKRRT